MSSSSRVRLCRYCHKATIILRETFACEDCTAAMEHRTASAVDSPIPVAVIADNPRLESMHDAEDAR